MMIKKFILTLIKVYLLWLLLVFVVVNPVVNYVVGMVYQQQTGRNLSYSVAQINPITLSFYAYDLEDRDPDGEIFWHLNKLNINLSLSSLFDEGVVLDEFVVRDFYVAVRRFKDGTFSFADIIHYREQLEPPIEKPNNPIEKPSEDEALPGLTIKKTILSVESIGFTDYIKADPSHAGLESINLVLEDFSTLHEEGRPYSFIARGPAGGELEWKGTLSVPGKSSRGHLELRDISMLPLWRFQKDDLNFDLLSGRFSVGGDYTLSWRNSAVPLIEIDQGYFSIDDYAMQARDDKGSYLQWQSISFNNIALNSSQQTVNISEAKIKQLNSRLQINKDGTTNFTNMFTVNFSDRQTNYDKKSPSKDKPDAPPWNLRLDKIIFENNTLDFSDLSLSSMFRVKIEEFSGEVSQLVSDATVPASIDLHGKVDGYAPVTLLGTVNPFLETPQLKVDFNLSHVDLSSVSPYSGDYAGWRIDRGLVSINLEYQLENGHLIGENRINVDQLKLGSRVEGVRLVDLPLRFAIALMTDENGAMNLDVPIEGSLDDPEFKISGIIWQAVRNLVVKIVSSPFKALASMLGSDADDLEFIAFPTGSFELNKAAQENLDAVKSVIDKRPILRLGVEGRYDKIKDTQYLQQQKFIVILQKKGLKVDDVKQQNKQYNKIITALYRQSFPERWDVPKKDKPTVKQQRRQLESEIIIDKAELQHLSKSRALAVKRYLLVDKGMSPENVFIQSAEEESAESSVQLVLEAK